MSLPSPSPTPTQIGIVLFARDMAESLELHLVNYLAAAVKACDAAPPVYKQDVAELFPILADKITSEIHSRCCSRLSAHANGSSPFDSYSKGQELF